MGPLSSWHIYSQPLLRPFRQSSLISSWYVPSTLTAMIRRGIISRPHSKPDLQLQEEEPGPFRMPRKLQKAKVAGIPQWLSRSARGADQCTTTSQPQSTSV